MSQQKTQITLSTCIPRELHKISHNFSIYHCYILHKINKSFLNFTIFEFISQVTDVVRRLMAEIRVTFRRQFLTEFSRDEAPLDKFEVSVEMQKKASAWYYVAYQSKKGSNNDEQSSKRFIGFPWIVDEILVTIPPSKKLSLKQKISPENAYSNIANSLGNLFSKQAEELIEGYQHRLQVKSIVERTIVSKRGSGKVVMFGSSATLFFEGNSDIDLCFLPAKELILSKNEVSLAKKIRHSEQEKLLKKLESCLRTIYNGVHFVKAKVPIFRLAGLKENEYTSKLCVDFCVNPDGFLKATVVSCYIHKNPPLLPLLRMLIKWARDSGLITKREGSLINTNVLTFMLLSFCVREGCLCVPEVEDVVMEIQKITTDQVLTKKSYLQSPKQMNVQV